MEKWKRVHIKKAAEPDGILYVMENNREIPFDIQRVFLVANVQQGKTRGDHATKRTRLVLFPVSGSCNVVVDDGETKESFQMNDPLIVFNSILKLIDIRIIQHLQEIMKIFDNIYFRKLINIYPLHLTLIR